MPHVVYILYSKKFDRFYVGTSSDISRRLNQHNNKESPSTAGGVPWVLVWHTKKSTSLDAESLENKLKNLSRIRKIKFMQKYHEGIVDEDLLNTINS